MNFTLPRNFNLGQPLMKAGACACAIQVGLFFAGVIYVKLRTGTSMKQALAMALSIPVMAYMQLVARDKELLTIEKTNSQVHVFYGC